MLHSKNNETIRMRKNRPSIVLFPLEKRKFPCLSTQRVRAPNLHKQPIQNNRRFASGRCRAAAPLSVGAFGCGVFPNGERHVPASIL